MHITSRLENPESEFNDCLLPFQFKVDAELMLHFFSSSIFVESIFMTCSGFLDIYVIINIMPKNFDIANSLLLYFLL